MVREIAGMGTEHAGSSLGRVLFEAVLIVLGVPLGLLANEMRLEQRDHARAHAALALALRANDIAIHEANLAEACARGMEYLEVLA
jgi:hypothetical protein